MLFLEKILHAMMIFLPRELPRGTLVLPAPFCDWKKKEIFKNVIHFDVLFWRFCFCLLGKWFLEVTFSSETKIGIEQIIFYTPQWGEWAFQC